MRPVLALLLSLALFPGCVSQSGYLNNRAADAVDIFRGNVQFGATFGVKLEATRLLHLGILYSHRAYALGLHNREVGIWRSSAFSWGLLVGHHDEIDTEPLPWVSDSYGWDFAARDGEYFDPGEEGGALDLLTFRASAMLVLGLDLEFRLGELIDFLGGIVGFDLSQDDVDYATISNPGGDDDLGSDRPKPPTGPEAGAG